MPVIAILASNSDATCSAQYRIGRNRRVKLQGPHTTNGIRAECLLCDTKQYSYDRVFEQEEHSRSLCTPPDFPALRSAHKSASTQAKS